MGEEAGGPPPWGASQRGLVLTLGAKQDGALCVPWAALAVSAPPSEGPPGCIGSFCAMVNVLVLTLNLLHNLHAFRMAPARKNGISSRRCRYRRKHHTLRAVTIEPI